MYWTKITGNLKVVELLKKREEIEKEIQQLDSKALINYELEKLAEPKAKGAKTGDDRCHIQRVIDTVCEHLHRTEYTHLGKYKCEDCGKWLDK